jgi:hypothetical protein
MAHGAVWLRVRTLSVLLWRRRRRAACRGLADWWNRMRTGSRIGIRTFRACRPGSHIHITHTHIRRPKLRLRLRLRLIIIIIIIILLRTRHIFPRRL